MIRPRQFDTIVGFHHLCSRVFGSTEPELNMTAEENVSLWLTHLSGEFNHRDVEESLATMVEDATVCHVPTGSGGSGKDELRRYYRDEFIPSIPQDWTHMLKNRLATVGGIAEE